ncbi:hypothetical protein [Bacillus toyonensis]|uniref:hypothetical protein n=1 Tax=Bacillus toyonensis TaxID=155322 RepID=UPI002E1CEB61|nr:hypothetical protein [Bacillus toyonensis]
MNKQQKIYTMPELYLEKIQKFLSDLNLETNYNLDVERIYNIYELGRKYDSSVAKDRSLLLWQFSKEFGGFHLNDISSLPLFNKLPVEYTEGGSELIKLVSFKYSARSSFTYELRYQNNYMSENMLLLICEIGPEILRYIIAEWEIRESFIVKERLAEEIIEGVIKSVSKSIEEVGIANKLLNEFPELLEEAYDRWTD